MESSTWIRSSLLNRFKCCIHESKLFFLIIHWSTSWKQLIINEWPFIDGLFHRYVQPWFTDKSSWEFSFPGEAWKQSSTWKAETKVWDHALNGRLQHFRFDRARISSVLFLFCFLLQPNLFFIGNVGVFLPCACHSIINMVYPWVNEVEITLIIFHFRSTVVYSSACVFIEKTKMILCRCSAHLSAFRFNNNRYFQFLYITVNIVVAYTEYLHELLKKGP